jgi:hypothetical protein
MRKLLIPTAALVVAAACAVDDESNENVRDTSGAGGSGGVACEFDDWRTSMAGAVFYSPVSPDSGSWCPRDQLEVCTRRAPSALTNNTSAFDAGPSGDSEGTISRCVGNAWQTVAGSTCEAENENCNVFNHREYDGQCCSHLRNCERAFCDGERWWTRR